jgi:hypothetical protein
MSSAKKAEEKGTVEEGTGHVHVDSEEALQEELRRETEEGSNTIGDISDNRNVSGSSSWVTQLETPKDGDQGDGRA